MQQNNSMNPSLETNVDLSSHKAKAKAEINEFFALCLPDKVLPKDEASSRFLTTAKKFYPELYREVLEAKRVVEQEMDAQSHGMKLNIWVSQSKKLIRLVTFRILAEYSRKNIKVIIE